MTIRDLFDELNTKDIICWGSGKHFRYITYPFLRDSGLIRNLKGFVDVQGSRNLVFGDRQYDRISKQELALRSDGQTVILISATGYREILSQIRSDGRLAHIDAIPSIFLEALYEDLMMLAAPKPQANFRRNDHPVIPGVIHTFWFSGEALPEKYQRCLDSWKRYAPDMEIKIWNLQNYDPGKCIFFRQAIEKKLWAFASDYARADVLRRYGGIYMDLDVELLRPIDELLYNDAYMSFESLSRIECGSGMGAKKGNRILEEICRDYESRPLIKEDGSLDLSTCPVRYTRIIEKHGLVKNGGFQLLDELTLYPFEMLTGKSFDTGIIYRTELSYSVHHHHGSWVPGHTQQAMDARYQEISEFLRERGIEL